MQKEDNLRNSFSLLFPKNKAAVGLFVGMVLDFEKELASRVKDGIKVDVEINTSQIGSIETFEVEVFTVDPRRRLYYVAEAYDMSMSSKEKVELLLGIISDMINAFNLLVLFDALNEPA